MKKNYLIEHPNELERLNFQNKIDVYDLEKELNFFKWDTKHLILDAGCGNGNVVEKLLEKGMTKIHGIDFSEDRVNFAQERFKDHKDVEFFKRSLEKTGMNDNSYDRVICRYIYEHVTNTSEIINELYRVTKPGGYLQIINFDDIFFNFYTKNTKLNEQLAKLKKSVPQDFEIGRKIPHIMRAAKFDKVEWSAETFFFKDERLEMEKENNRMRLHQGREHLAKFFSSVEEYDEFAKTYLAEMDDDCNVLAVTKFLVKGQKSLEEKFFVIK